MPASTFLAAAAMAVAQPPTSESDLVPLIDCPYFPVYFRRDAVALDKQQRRQLGDFAAMVRQFRLSERASIVISAYAPARDQGRWSRQRLDRVVAYLISYDLGVASLRISAEPATEGDLLGGPAEDPEISYVVYRLLVPPADRERLFPPGSPLC